MTFTKSHDKLKQTRHPNIGQLSIDLSKMRDKINYCAQLRINKKFNLHEVSYTEVVPMFEQTCWLAFNETSQIAVQFILVVILGNEFSY